MYKPNSVIKVIIWINLIVWLLAPNEAIKEYGFVSSNPSLLTVFTSMFLHAGLMHVVFNMMFLHAVEDIEKEFGKVWFIGAYLVSGLAAVGFQYLYNTSSTIPMVGASGAISGMLGAAYILIPHDQLGTINPKVWEWFTKKKVFINPTIKTFTKWFLIINLVFGVKNVIWFEEGAGVAWWAHIGGLVAGYFVAYIFNIMYPADEEDRPFDEPLEKNTRLRDAWGLK